MSGFRFSLSSVLLVALFLASFNTFVQAHSPVEFLEVLSVESARPIQHGVELKSKFDDQKIETQLEGPRFFSGSVGCLNRSAKKKRAFLNWFKIVDAPKEPIRQLSVLDMVRGSSNKALTIQGAEYLLSPSQLITTGVPDAIPAGLDHYKAYRVVDAPSLDQQVVLNDSFGPAERKLGVPRFVCLPVRQWHHDEYVSATHANDCFVVYELDEQDHEQKFSTMDQFGLNELETSKSVWLCVRAALLPTRSE